jgi:hypothetical protein
LVFVFITSVTRDRNIVMFIRLIRLLSVVPIILVISVILALQGSLRLLRLVPRQSDKHISFTLSDFYPRCDRDSMV